VEPIYTNLELIFCETDECETELNMLKILKEATYININDIFKYIEDFSELANKKLIFQNCNANGIRIDNNSDIIIPNTGKYQFIISTTTFLDLSDVDLISSYLILVTVNNNVLYTSSYSEFITNALGGGSEGIAGTFFSSGDIIGSIEKYINFNANDIINIYLLRTIEDNTDIYIQNFSVILKQL
jgi:hypothetical protein